MGPKIGPASAKDRRALASAEEPINLHGLRAGEVAAQDLRLARDRFALGLSAEGGLRSVLVVGGVGAIGGALAELLVSGNRCLGRRESRRRRSDALDRRSEE